MLFQLSQSREEENICVMLFIYSTFKIMPFPGIVQKKIIKLYNSQYYYNFTGQNST